MKAMSLPFEEFQGKGFPLNFSSSSSSSSDSPLLQQKWNPKEKRNCYVGSEPTSVLDTRRRRPSPPTSSSTDTVAAPEAAPLADPSPPAILDDDHLHHHLSYQKCGGGGAMEDWESVLSESSPGQEQSILRLIMADVDDEDNSLGLNKLLQHTGRAQGMEFNGGFGVVDDDDQVGYGSFDEFNRLIGSASSNPITTTTTITTNLSSNNNNNNNAQMFSNNFLPVQFSPAMFQQQQLAENLVPQMVMNQSQAQFVRNPGLVVPLAYTQLQHHPISSPPPAKRLNTGVPGPAQFQYSVAQLEQHQFQLLSQQIPAKPKSGIGDEPAIADQLAKAAELIETGNPVLVQGILARLNHQLSPLGKPLHRAAFYFKEALQLLAAGAPAPAPPPPFNLIFKIGAHKAFAEASPVLQFANFTCNQAILEATEGFARIHVVDFDLGLGGQWASLMQELALRNTAAAVSLKLTAVAVAAPATHHHDELELGFTLENLKHFAAELSLPLELEVLTLEAAINSGPVGVSLGEAVAVNLPVGPFTGSPASLPAALRFAKRLEPKIMVSMERGCDRVDGPFPAQVVHGLSSYATLLESIDAVNPEAAQKIERCLVQPGIERMILGRVGRSGPNRGLPAWRALVGGSGFSAVGFSNLAESQAECLVQRTPVRGFHVEKRHLSLVLCWQRKDLAAVSAWR